jgi:hypothetical protein
MVVGHRLVDIGHGFLHGLAQARAALEAHSKDVGAEIEVVHPDVVHLRHVEVIAIGEESVGIVGLAEEAGSAAFANDVRFLKRPRKNDEGEHRLGGRLQADDIRAEVWVILGARRFELAGRRDLVGRVAGHDLVDGRGVIEEAVRHIAHRTDHRELVVDLREIGQDFGEIDAGNLRADVRERAADFVRHIFLGIPEIQVTGAALKIDEDDALRLSPAGPTFDCGFRGCLGAETQQRTEGHAENGGASDADEIAPGDAEMSVAKIATGLSWDAQHRFVGFLSGV